MNDADTIMKTTCANCGKGEESTGDLKACTACKLVKYCNRECQIAHRPQHKKICKKRAAELHDEALFKEHPPPEDCPICLIPLPLDGSESTFQSCCGKLICNGCIYAMVVSGGNNICAFCRVPTPTSIEENTKRTKNLTKADNAYAFTHLAGYYADGDGVPQDFTKANELYLRAGELGHAGAYNNLGSSYMNGDGVEVDMKKANHYFELAAMNGDVNARHYLGWMKEAAGNYHQAYKHYILAAKAGDKDSLDQAKEGFVNGIVTKDEYANTLRAYKKIQDEMKSDARDKARNVFQMMDVANRIG